MEAELGVPSTGRSQGRGGGHLGALRRRGIRTLEYPPDVSRRVPFRGALVAFGSGREDRPRFAVREFQPHSSVNMSGSLLVRATGLPPPCSMSNHCSVQGRPPPKPQRAYGPPLEPTPFAHSCHGL